MVRCGTPEQTGSQPELLPINPDTLTMVSKVGPQQLPQRTNNTYFPS